MKALVAIHDVTPAHRLAVHELWALCRARGIVPALFVVPSWHGCWPLRGHPEFVDWLAAASGQGRVTAGPARKRANGVSSISLWPS